MKYRVTTVESLTTVHEVDVELPFGVKGPKAQDMSDALMREQARSGQQIISASDIELAPAVKAIKVTEVMRDEYCVYPRRRTHKEKS